MMNINNDQKKEIMRSIVTKYLVIDYDFLFGEKDEIYHGNIEKLRIYCEANNVKNGFIILDFISSIEKLKELEKETYDAIIDQVEIIEKILGFEPGRLNLIDKKEYLIDYVETTGDNRVKSLEEVNEMITSREIVDFIAHNALPPELEELFKELNICLGGIEIIFASPKNKKRKRVQIKENTVHYLVGNFDEY